MIPRQTESLPEFTRVFRASLSDHIIEQMTGLLARGVLKPGDRIPSEKQLCQRFGVGRTSVREAGSRCCATSNDRPFRIDRDRLGGRDAGSEVAESICAALATSRPATAPATLREGADWPMIPPQPVRSVTIRPRSGDPGWVECTAAEDSLQWERKDAMSWPADRPDAHQEQDWHFRTNLARISPG